MAVTCGCLLQGQLRTKDLSRRDEVRSTECVFKLERSIGIKKFRYRTVHREASERRRASTYRHKIYIQSGPLVVRRPHRQHALRVSTEILISLLCDIRTY